MDRYSLTTNVLIMLASGVAQIMVWACMNFLFSKVIRRTIKDDYEICIKEKIVGPAIIRLGIMLPIALMVISAFDRNL